MTFGFTKYYVIPDKAGFHLEPPMLKTNSKSVVVVIVAVDYVVFVVFGLIFAVDGDVTVVIVVIVVVDAVVVVVVDDVVVVVVVVVVVLVVDIMAVETTHIGQIADLKQTNKNKQTNIKQINTIVIVFNQRDKHSVYFVLFTR